MKTKSTEIFSQLSETEIKDLIWQVEEIIVPNFKNSRSANITVASLWNIQRNKKHLRRRKFYQNA